MVAPCGGGWALRAGMEMTINLPGHPYVSDTVLVVVNDTHFIRFVYLFTSFPTD